MIYCDSQTGICTLADHAPEQSGQTDPKERAAVNTVFYFGDPMCSWCWGIAPEVEKLVDYCKPEIGFKLVMGGLRQSESDIWNDDMKKYLRHHWGHVTEKSGQPFNYDLFERNRFVYNTEPSCRAVKVFEHIDSLDALKVYHKIQKRFYVENDDPNDVQFYEPICQQFGISFGKFQEIFEAEYIKKLTAADFNFTQQIGVSAFPTLLVQYENSIHTLAYGYATFEQMKSRIVKTNSQIEN